jgi:hypothetical protein
MTAALTSHACDGIGLGRPLAAEPYLCAEISSGRVSGAIESRMPLPLNTQSSGTQLHQIGHGEEAVSDWSAQGEVDRWIEANEREMERKEKVLPIVDSSGYAWIKAGEGFCYLES